MPWCSRSRHIIYEIPNPVVLDHPDENTEITWTYEGLVRIVVMTHRDFLDECCMEFRPTAP